MGTHRMAAVAAVSHARQYYNVTQPDVVQSEATQYSVAAFFISAISCGVLVAICAACWPRAPAGKPDDVIHHPRHIYTVSADVRTRDNVHQVRELCTDLPEAPPAYDSVVEDQSRNKSGPLLEEVVTERCGHCSKAPDRPDAELPSYEAAVMLRDTKL